MRSLLTCARWAGDTNYLYKMLSYRRETTLQGGLVMTKSGRLEVGDNLYGHIDLYSTTVMYRYLASKAIKLGEKRKIRALTQFKVIQAHRDRYQLKARMQLPISD